MNKLSIGDEKLIVRDVLGERLVIAYHLILKAN